MKTSLFYLPSVGSRADIERGLAGTRPELYRQMLDELSEQARLADDLGYDSISFTEHHFHIEGFELSNNPVLLDLFVAMQTRRIRVGQLGIVLPASNPIRVAEDIAMLDHMSGGRANAGFARGYQRRWVDIMAGGQKTPEFLKLNPMGKLPVLVDGAAVVSESAAIALYLGDRHAAGRLAPALDDPARGTYLRWAFFSPSVLEPAAAAKASGGEFNAGAVGWGTYESMLDATEVAVGNGPYLLGERNRFAITGGYRYMAVEYRTERDSDITMTMSGFLGGFRFAF